MSRVRIVNRGGIAAHMHVIYVADDGTETDISSCVTRVDVAADVASRIKATVELIKVDVDIIETKDLVAA